MSSIRATNYTTVLSIAGSDGSGGAGIQADLKTCAALGCYGLSVVTDITAQNTHGVHDSFALPPMFVRRQFEVLAEDIAINAIKIGMISQASTIRAIAEALRNRPPVPVILDTVLKSSSGRDLVSEDAKASTIKELFPLATLVTPNLPEAAELAGSDRVPAEKSAIENIAEALRAKGTAAVLVKGGHMRGDTCKDYLLSEKGGEWFSSRRISTKNTHGTGCTLSSAIAAYTAMGHDLHEAVRKGRLFTLDALQAGSGFLLGKGAGPLHHFYRCRDGTQPRGDRPME